jgi:hypothetical protein
MAPSFNFQPTPSQVRCTKKTWEYERAQLTDRSNVGLYFASGSANAVRALTLSPAGLVLEEDFRAIAIYPDAVLANVNAKVEAVRPDGSREQLIGLRAQNNWARRYWFSQPVALTRGTRISVDATVDTQAQAIAASAAPAPPDASNVRLTLNVVPVTR